MKVQSFQVFFLKQDGQFCCFVFIFQSSINIGSHFFSLSLQIALVFIYCYYISYLKSFKLSTKSCCEIIHKVNLLLDKIFRQTCKFSSLYLHEILVNTLKSFQLFKVGSNIFEDSHSPHWIFSDSFRIHQTISINDVLKSSCVICSFVTEVLVLQQHSRFILNTTAWVFSHLLRILLVLNMGQL